MPEKLANILARVDESFAGTIRHCRLVALWPEIVDERIRQNTQAVKIANKTLFVSTSSPAWAQELGFFKQALITKFNERAGQAAIRDIRFKALA